MIEFNQQLNSVRRQVGDSALETGDGRVVTIRQTYTTGVDDL